MVRDFSVGPIGENVYIVERAGSPLVLVDPGAEPERILAELDASRGRSGAEAVLVVCTHGHLDHVAALAGVLDGLRRRGVSCRTYAPEGDRPYFGAPAEDRNRRIFTGIHALAFFKKHWLPIPEADEYYGDGFAFPGTDIVAIHTPGHTPGSSCLLVEGGSALLSGDTLFFDGRGRTDNFDSDEGAIVASIRERLCVLPDSTRVWPGHGRPTVMGREKKYYI